MLAVPRHLEVFAATAPRHDRGRVLNQLMGLSLLVSTALGLWLVTVEAPLVPVRPRRNEPQRITFHAPILPTPVAPAAPAYTCAKSNKSSSCSSFM